MDRATSLRGSFMTIDYSIVIPIKDEEENIEELIDEVEAVMKTVKGSFEILCIDDGSKDQSLAILKRLSGLKPHLRILVFTKNFGQSSAFSAGFEAARGQYVITLDGDRQNDPQDIPKMIEAIADCDLVVGWRKERKDPWQKKIISKLSNFVRSRLCQDGVHDTGCSLKIYRKSALKKIKMYRGMHRFLPALFQIEGFKVKEIPVHHRERKKGKTKYHFFNRSLGPLFDMWAVFWMRRRALHHEIREMWPKEDS